LLLTQLDDMAVLPLVLSVDRVDATQLLFLWLLLLLLFFFVSSFQGTRMFCGYHSVV